MKPRIALIWILLLSAAVVAGQSIITFDQIFPPNKQQGMGLHKLNEAEKAALKSHVEGLLRAMIEKAQATSQTPGQPALAKPLPPVVVRESSVYLTKIEEDNDEILKLENGAVVEITGGSGLKARGCSDATSSRLPQFALLAPDDSATSSKSKAMESCFQCWMDRFMRSTI